MLSEKSIDWLDRETPLLFVLTIPAISLLKDRNGKEKLNLKANALNKSFADQHTHLHPGCLWPWRAVKEVRWACCGSVVFGESRTSSLLPWVFLLYKSKKKTSFEGKPSFHQLNHTRDVVALDYACKRRAFTISVSTLLLRGGDVACNASSVIAADSDHRWEHVSGFRSGLPSLQLSSNFPVIKSLISSCASHSFRSKSCDSPLLLKYTSEFK